MSDESDSETYSVEAEEQLQSKSAGKMDSVIRISGSGTLSEVNARELSISGSGKVNGPVNVENMHVSGSAKVQGKIDCRSSLNVSGTLKAESDVRAEEITSSGSIYMGSCNCNSFVLSGTAEIEGTLSADTVEDSGTLRSGSVKCRSLKFKGVIKAGTLEADNAQIHGAVNAKTVKSPKFELESMGWGTDIENLSGDSIRITVRKRLILPGPSVSVDEINARVVDIEGVKCKKIVAERVDIGDNCNVDYVEAATIMVSGKSRVGERKTLEKPA